LHPDQRKLAHIVRRQLPSGILWLAGLLLWNYLRFGNDIAFDVALVLLFLFLTAAGYFLVTWNATLFAYGTTFGETTAVRRKRTFDLTALTGVDRLTVRQSFQPAVAQFLVLGPNGTVQMKIREDRWSEDDLNRLWRRLNLTPTGSFDRVLNYREFKRAYGDR
jgi:hypothetical protein